MADKENQEAESEVDEESSSEEDDDHEALSQYELLI